VFSENNGSSNAQKNQGFVSKIVVCKGRRPPVQVPQSLPSEISDVSSESVKIKAKSSPIRPVEKIEKIENFAKVKTVHRPN
jgi:hypothetical protein